MDSLRGDSASEGSTSTAVEGGAGQDERRTSSRSRSRSTPARPYRVYPQRWRVLATVVLLNISNAAIWISIAPVAYKASEYFGVAVGDVNWFSMVFLFVSIPFCFIATLTVNQLGLKPSIHIGSALNCLGGLIRALATCGLFPDHVQFPVCLSGQVVAAMAQSFLLFIPTKVSQLWFPEDSRALSTTILSLSNPLGILLTQVASPLIVADTDQLPIINYVVAGVAVLTQVVTLFCVTRSRPPTPPSQSAARGEGERESYLRQLKDVFTCPPYLLLLLAIGCGVALFTSLATVTQQILCPLGYTDVFSGGVMGLMILSGFVGSAVTGVAADRTKAFTPIIKLCYGIANIAAIIMLEMFLVPGQPVLVGLSCAVFGFFGVGAYPIGLELAVEATYPVEESISTAFIFMSGQAQGVLIIAMVSLLSRDLQPKYENVEVCTTDENSGQEPRDYTVSVLVIMGLLTFMVLLVIIFFRTPYKRLEAERSRNSSSPSPSSSSSHSLTPTSGYGSEPASKENTVASRASGSRSAVTILREEVEADVPEVLMSHL